MKNNVILLFSMLLFMIQPMVMAESTDTTANPDRLVVLWTSGDPYVAEKVAFMYTHAAKKNKWFDEVTLIIWGPSAKLLSENMKLQEKIKAMQKDGVILEACIVCADSYNVTEDLEEMGIVVKGMGKPLSDYLKGEEKVLTF